MLTAITPIKKKNISRLSLDWQNRLGFARVPRSIAGKHKLTQTSRLKAYCSACVPVYQIDHRHVSHSFHGHSRNIAKIQHQPFFFFTFFSDHTAIRKPSLEVYTIRNMLQTSQITWCDMPCEPLIKNLGTVQLALMYVFLVYIVNSNTDNTNVILEGNFSACLSSRSRWTKI